MIYVVAGTSCSTPLMASIYAIINSNIKQSHHGEFNTILLNAFNECRQIFRPILSLSELNNNNGAGGVAPVLPDYLTKYSYNVGRNRFFPLYRQRQQNCNTGLGFDCYTGLGSIDATKLMCYMKNYEK